MKNRWNKALMAGGFRNCRDELYWSLDRRELNERSGTCMATACNRLKDAGRILFAARLVITAMVMIRSLRGMTNVIENVMDLMGCRGSQECEKQRRDEETRPATQSLVIGLHYDPGIHS